ncbi:hypothetical protein NA647_18725 [Pseudomonas stutzeri]|uniref:HipA family kinase n=1 Tax=Stutzerimonas stutzeri TaxID=316 RepID=UPI00210D4869|nr:HipA family kinase [Stutzerimonas stutzeri]MCQ4289456.1 hypothetical protein [Stutzerimonas stutzeri]
MTKDATSGDSLSSRSGSAQALPIEARYQKTLIPIEAITTFNSNMGSADLKQIVEARDGKHYAVKTTRDGAGKVPASEFFCYELACRVVIPTPAFAIISMPQGDLAFGSLWEGGVVNGNKRVDYQAFVMAVLQGKTKVPNLKAFLSRLYAFDLFVNNVDRHWGNYLWRSSFGDSFIALAFDFSRACFEVGHLGFEAVHPASNTQIAFRMINLTKNYIRAEALGCLEAIEAIDSNEIATILENFPASWMSKADRKAYIDWWDSQARLDRISSLKNTI